MSQLTSKDIVRLYTELGSIRKVIKETGINGKKIKVILEDAGIALNTRKKISSEEELQMRNMYEIEQKTLKQIASYFGIEHRQVSRRLKKMGVEIRANLPYEFPEEVYEKWAEYYRLGYTYKSIGEIYGVARETVRDYLQKKMAIPSRVSSKKFDEETYLLWIELYEEGATLEEIATDFGVSQSTVVYQFEKRGLERRSGFKHSEDDHKEWMKLYGDGFNTREIANLYDTSKYCIGFHLKRNGIKLRESSEWNLAKPELLHLELSYEQKQVILGSVLGDGTLYDQAVGAYLRIKHALKQKEYLEYKVTILGELISNAGLVHTETTANEKSFQQVYACTVPNIYIKNLRDISYIEGKRVISKIIPDLDNLGLAILWCDDGHYTKYKSGILNTLNFSYEDNELLAQHMRRNFLIDCYVQIKKDKKYNKTYPYIYITVKGMSVMKNLIKSYIPDSMKYKIGE